MNNFINRVKTKSFNLAVFARGNENAKKFALFIPGRLDTKDYANFISHVEYLAKHGFLAVAFDPPGTWGSSGKNEEYTTTNYMKSINELIEFFGNRPTLLVGHSRGASVAMLTSMFNSTIIGVVLIMANYGAPTPPNEQAKQRGFDISYRDLPPGTSKTDEQKKFLLPISYWEDGGRYNPLQALKKCTKPKLLIYGTNDEFTSPEEVKHIYENIPEPKMLIEIKSKHDYRYDSKAIERVNEAIGKFLQKFLKIYFSS